MLSGRAPWRRASVEAQKACGKRIAALRKKCSRIAGLAFMSDGNHRSELVLNRQTLGSSNRRCTTQPLATSAVPNVGAGWCDAMSQMNADRSRAALARIYDNPDERGELLTYAARFFGQSIRRTRLGVDAHWLMSTAIDKILEAGFPDDVREPVAYIKRVIKTTWIDKYRQHRIIDRRQSEIDDEYGQHDEPNFVDELVDDLAQPAEADAIAQQFEEFLSRHRPPVPGIVRAMRDHPQLVVSDVAKLTGTSERTVYRAKNALKNDASMRALLDQLSKNAAPEYRQELP